MNRKYCRNTDKQYVFPYLFPHYIQEGYLFNQLLNQYIQHTQKAIYNRYWYIIYTINNYVYFLTDISGPEQHEFIIDNNNFLLLKKAREKIKYELTYDFWKYWRWRCHKK